MSQSAHILSLTQLQSLFDALQADTYTLFGPVRGDYAIQYGRISQVSDLPIGVHDEQRPGYYRLQDSGDGQLFAHTTSPDSWKKYLFPKEEVLYSATQADGHLMFKTAPLDKQKKAFIGIRSCDLHAIGVQDRVFIEGDYVDSGYAARRSDLFIVAVNCTRSTETCFCASLNSGPAASSGYDIALTEVKNENEHYFLAEVGSSAGDVMLRNSLTLKEAEAQHVSAARAAVNNAAAQQVRRMPTEQLKETIYSQLQNEGFWQQVGERCLHCANCTLVCPTCFCSSVADTTDLSGEQHDRVRYWDSCFNLDHSHIAGGSVREAPNSRYRQWFNHKLASWQDQFDTLGCTGCGRCVTWCPVGIDITEEAQRVFEYAASEVSK